MGCGDVSSLLVCVFATDAGLATNKLMTMTKRPESEHSKRCSDGWQAWQRQDQAAAQPLRGDGGGPSSCSCLA